MGGSSKDFIISEWRYHPTADIAAAVCDWDTNEYVANWQEVEYFSDVYPAGMPIKVGHPVFFMGLLGHVDSLSDHVIPMMRGGKLGAVWVENVPVNDKDSHGQTYTRDEPMAHLIDCFSRSGFSGAPVYVDHPYFHVVPLNEEIPEKGIATYLSNVPSFSALCGVLIGHFGSPGDNAGVAVVVP